MKLSKSLNFYHLPKTPKPNNSNASESYLNAISQVARFNICISLNKPLWTNSSFGFLVRNFCRNDLKFFVCKTTQAAKGKFFYVNISKTFFCRRLWKSTFLKKVLLRKYFTSQIWEVKDFLNRTFFKKVDFQNRLQKKVFEILT